MTQRFEIDYRRGILAQLCEEPGKISLVVDARRGFYYHHQTETARDDAEDENYTLHLKGRKARKHLRQMLGDDGKWCRNGHLRTDSEFIETLDHKLGTNKPPTTCAHRGQPVEWGSQEYICFVREGGKWFVYAAAHIPDGNFFGEYLTQMKAGWMRAKRLGLRLYRPN